ncbi:amiloride-sensitive sodium channel subunit gamma-2, partial [Biomphalaria glabrata]
AHFPIMTKVKALSYLEKAVEKDDKKSSKLWDTFTFYTSRVSLHGIVFAVDSKHTLNRSLWILILLGATAALTVQLYNNINRYFEYGTRSEIHLGFSSLEFPAITLCNVNIMRMSMLNESSSDLQEFIASLQKLDLRAKAGSSRAEKKGFVNEYGKNNYGRNVYFNDFLDSYDAGAKLNDSEVEDYDQGEDSYYDTSKPKSWSAVGKRSFLVNLFDKLTDYYSFMDLSKQQNVSHQFDDMLRQCSFATRRCIKNFTKITYSDHGNCYTIQNKSYVSYTSGPQGGLQLILYLETDEYLPLLTSGKGAQIVIHKQKTIPLPDDGISVSVGQQTMIGIQQTRISRLGEPYSKCRNVEEFFKKYKAVYTRKLCKKMCLLERISKECKCEYRHYQPITELFNFTSSNVCNSSQDAECVARIRMSFRADDDNCGCYDPCEETVFETQISSRSWPNKDIADVLMAGVCSEKPAVCSKTYNEIRNFFRDNFLKVNIFYRDLNYKKITEIANYEVHQLLSDIGGSLGLWMGLSVLSLLEILQVTLHLLQCWLGCRQGVSVDLNMQQ